MLCQAGTKSSPYADLHISIGMCWVAAQTIVLSAARLDPVTYCDVVIDECQVLGRHVHQWTHQLIFLGQALEPGLQWVVRSAHGIPQIGSSQLHARKVAEDTPCCFWILADVKH